jgi:hypothetical protein
MKPLSRDYYIERLDRQQEIWIAQSSGNAFAYGRGGRMPGRAN